MSKIIEEYYIKANIPPVLIKLKLKKMEKHKDIADEFEYWITHKEYKKDECLYIQGYSGQMISKLSQYLNGEGAFMFMVELRENPKKAQAMIASGFVVK